MEVVLRRAAEVVARAARWVGRLPYEAQVLVFVPLLALLIAAWFALSQVAYSACTALYPAGTFPLIDRGSTVLGGSPVCSSITSLVCVVVVCAAFLALVRQGESGT